MKAHFIGISTQCRLLNLNLVHGLTDKMRQSVSYQRMSQYLAW